MNYKVITENNLHFSGITKNLTTKNGENFQEIPKLWQTVMQNQTFRNLLSKADELGVVGISYGYNDADQTFNYMIGIRTKEDEQEMDNISFQPQTFLAFEAIGSLPMSLQNVIKKVHQEFLPKSEYKMVEGPEIEVYPEGDGSKPDYKCYYYLPVKEK